MAIGAIGIGNPDILLAERLAVARAPGSTIELNANRSPSQLQLGQTIAALELTATSVSRRASPSIRSSVQTLNQREPRAGPVETQCGRRPCGGTSWETIRSRSSAARASGC